MKRSIIAIALSAVAALSLVPSVSSADHCTDVFIFQGADAGNGVRRGFNTGFVGCNIDETDESLNTNKRVPGAQVAIVGVIDDFGVPEDGTLQIGDGEPVDLTWELNTVNGRYDSQSVALTGEGDLVAKVTIGGSEISVTYTA